MWRFPGWEAEECTGSSAARQARPCMLPSHLQLNPVSCSLTTGWEGGCFLRSKKPVKSDAYGLIHSMYKYIHKYSRENNFWALLSIHEFMSCPTTLTAQAVQMGAMCFMLSAPLRSNISATELEGRKEGGWAGTVYISTCTPVNHVTFCLE